MANVHIQQLRGGPQGGATGTAGSHRTGNFNGVELSADVDDVNRATALRTALTGREAITIGAHRQLPQLIKAYKGRILDLQQLARHAKLSGDQREVYGNSLRLLRQRLLRPNKGQQAPGRSTLPSRGTPAWKLAGNRPAMRQYLALQKMQAALKIQQAARAEKKSEEEAEDEFMAAMAPLADNPGNAAGLAQLFYQAFEQDGDLKDLLYDLAQPADDPKAAAARARKLDDALARNPELQDLLSGFEGDERTALLEELRTCDVIEEYDPRQKTTRKTFDRRQFCAGLKRAMKMDGFRLSDERVRDLLEDTQGQLSEMEGDPGFGRYATGALNVAKYAEQLQEKGQDGLQFIDDYSELVHSEASMASMLNRAAQLWVPAQGHIDLVKLRVTMEAASAAAELDMESTYRSNIDKYHLHAAIQSAKLIARLTTAVMLAETARDFLQRHFGRDIDTSQLLRELLERMANPNAPASEFLALTERMNLQGEAAPATLKQAADFFRTMHDMYPDPRTRQSLLQNILDAMDYLADEEDKELAKADPGDSIPIIKSSQPNIPSTQQGAATWTGFGKR